MRTSAAAKPALADASHCIGVRSGSRPTMWAISGWLTPADPGRVRGGMRHIFHADLVAVVAGGRAAQGEQQHGGDARLRRPDAGGDAVLVVVAQHPIGPGAGREIGFVLIHQPAHGLRMPRR
jgi:hypothetical protein